MIAGNEYTAVVEFAPFQKVPKNKVRKTDIKNGAIEQGWCLSTLGGAVAEWVRL